MTKANEYGRDGWIVAILGVIVLLVSGWAYFTPAYVAYVDYIYIGIGVGALMFIGGMWLDRPKGF